MNCWEFKKCGRDQAGACPAFPKFGETCFYVAGTLCAGEVQGDYAKKINNCRKECDFYKTLMAQPDPLLSSSRQRHTERTII
jgi:hypothetical protein